MYQHGCYFLCLGHGESKSNVVLLLRLTGQIFGRTEACSDVYADPRPPKIMKKKVCRKYIELGVFFWYQPPGNSFLTFFFLSKHMVKNYN